MDCMSQAAACDGMYYQIAPENDDWTIVYYPYETRETRHTTQFISLLRQFHVN